MAKAKAEKTKATEAPETEVPASDAEKAPEAVPCEPEPEKTTEELLDELQDMNTINTPRAARVITKLFETLLS